MKNFNFKLLFVSLIFVCSGITTNAQILKETKPEQAGMSTERLEMLDDFIQKYIDDKKVPGGIFLVARKGNIVYNKSFGMRNNNEAYKQGDIFRIASMTKAVTTVAIMQLYEQGKLGLDEPRSKIYSGI